MSLNGAKIVSKMIENMEIAETELMRLAGRDPNSVAGRQDDRLRSIVRCKLAEVQDEMEKVITHPDDRPQAMTREGL